jgi:transcriptional regulator
MYVPKMFHEGSWPEIKKMIEENSFATVITCNAGLPTATHVPLRLLESASGPAKLQGHMSRANPHWRLFELEHEQQSLVIFSGPNAYVSARWYDHVNVPTWNYIAVHVYGKARVVTDAGEMHQLIKGLVDHFEHGLYKVQDLPADFLEPQRRGIVGFEISVDEVQASFKLSQNRDQKNYDNVITELRKSDDAKAQDVAQIMSNRRCPR